MDKKEILDEISKVKEHLANLEERLKQCNYERWKPKDGEKYWYIDDKFELHNAKFTNSLYDDNKIETYNCFQTKEEAEQEAEKILIRRQLEDIAKRLNKGEKFDWKRNQSKWYLFWDWNYEKIRSYECFNFQGGEVYCLDRNFKDVAIREIGEEKLKNYLRGE